MLRVTLQSSRRGAPTALHGLTVALPASALAAAPVCSIRTATRFATRHHITATCTPCTAAAPTCALSSSRAIASGAVVQRRGASEKKVEKKMNFGGADDVPAANPEAEDLYQRLGLTKSASKQEIKKNFRILAKKHHPDANNSSAESSRIFKRLKQANEVLSDEEQRRVYDHTGKAEEPWAKYTGGRRKYNLSFEHGWYATRTEEGGTVTINLPPHMIIIAILALLALPYAMYKSSSEGGVMRTVIRFVAILGLVSVLPRLPAAAAVFYLYAMPSTTPQWQKDAALMMTVYPPPAPELVPSRVITFANLPADIVATHKVVVGARIVSPAVAGVDSTAATDAEQEALKVESKVGTVTVALPTELFATKGAKGALKKLALPQGAEVNAVVALQDSAGTAVLEKTVKFPVTA